MSTAKTTREGQGNNRTAATLYLAFELGRHRWKLGFTTGMAQRPRERTIPASDLARIEIEIEQARRRFHLPGDAEVFTCYEAGRDGFWLHRFLEAIGHRSHVVDSSSIEVNRRARRAKTDSLDLAGLLRLLIRYHGGERKVWSVVRVPSPEAEDARHLHRELLTLKREWARHRFLSQEIRELERTRQALLRKSTDPAVEQVRQLLALQGIGMNSAWLYVMEFFAWREFRNRREVGALAGLTPTPHQSGDSHREQGIGKAGNRRIRAMAIEIAWGWLRYQPDSELSRWYHGRFGPASPRMRKVGIVALARKLLIALWRYLETGVIPEGAIVTQR